MRQRLKRFVKLWVDLFSRHLLLDHASAIAFQVLKALVPLTLLGIALLGVLGQRKVCGAGRADPRGRDPRRAGRSRAPVRVRPLSTGEPLVPP